MDQPSKPLTIVRDPAGCDFGAVTDGAGPACACPGSLSKTEQIFVSCSQVSAHRIMYQDELGLNCEILIREPLASNVALLDVLADRLQLLL